jgi:hypothetical protein
MYIKTELQALLDQVDSLAPHVRDTGDTAYGAARHQAEMVLGMADQALTPPKVPTGAMLMAGDTAMANLPADTAPHDVVTAILTAGLGAV